MALKNEVILFGFFLLGDVAWCHSMLICFVSGSKGWKQLLQPDMMLWSNTSPLTAYLSNNCEEIFWIKFVPLSQKSRNIKTQIFWHPKFSTAPGLHEALFQSLLPVPWLSLFVHYYSVSLGRRSSRTNAMWLTGDVYVLLFKMHLPCEIYSDYACLFTYIFNSCVNIRCWDFFFNTQFSHCILPKRHVLGSQNLYWNISKWRGQATWF